MNPTAEILPFPRGLLARRGTGAIVGQPASGAKSFAPRLGGKTPRSHDAVKGKRLASLMAAAGRVVLKAECRALVQSIQAHAQREEWSSRETAKRTGLERTTFARLAQGEGKLAYWMPRLRAAVARLNQVGRVAPRAPKPEELAP